MSTSGILTARGGMTSHASGSCSRNGTCCVAGADNLVINEEKGFFTINGHKFNEGDYISLDGSTGLVYGEKIATVEAVVSGDFATLMAWADEYKALEIRTNADNPRDAKVARDFGATGIGLCRTEHMFFEADRIKAVREMIVAKSAQEREVSLKTPIQRQDFIELYEVMDGLSNYSLPDPPLHEFLPHNDNDIKALKRFKYPLSRTKNC